jgi:TPR repeat protein
MLGFRTTAIGALSIAAGLALAGCAPAPATLAKDKSCSGPGVGFSVPPSTATRAAMTGLEAAAQLSLGELYERAAKGDAVGQVELGLRYANGTGVDKNGERAVALFSAAADQGSAPGQFFLGTAFVNGFGVPKDEIRGIVHFEDAARQGYPIAQYWLGFMVANGRAGISPDWCAAMPMFEAAGFEHVQQSALQVGLIHQEGYTGERNYDMAAFWFRKASEKTVSQIAQLNLRKLIEGHLVAWQPGDPGNPPPPKGASQDEGQPAAEPAR